MPWRSTVVPRVGTWIEISQTFDIDLKLRVVPRVGTWIEIYAARSAFALPRVVPRVGTWIEIFGKVRKIGGLTVVPRVGTWIEIQLTYGRITQALSSPAWGRGEKFYLPICSLLGNIGVPRVG